MPDALFPKAIRLTRQSDFDRVYAVDHFAADDTLVVRARRNEIGFSRLGVSLSRRVGNAVVRNGWKRRIRESFRRQKYDLPQGLDLVVRPRKGAVCDYQRIGRSLKRLAEKLDRKMPQDEP